MAIDNNDYLVDALGVLRKHAKMKFNESGKFYRRAGRRARGGFFNSASTYYKFAESLEDQARKDLEQIQRILANPNLNK